MNLLFLNSSLSSVVTAASLDSSNIHSAASETARSSSDAIPMRACSFKPWMRSGLSEKELVLRDMKSDKSQKNVTV
jgi:hypothetical protein